MSQSNQATTENQKPYHTPQLRKFGNIKDLTLASPFSGNFTRDSTGINYAS